MLFGIVIIKKMLNNYDMLIKDEIILNSRIHPFTGFFNPDINIFTLTIK